MGLVMTSITAIVGIDPVTGDEGLWAFLDDLGKCTPMVCADEERVQMMFHVAEQMRKASGIEYKVLQFSTREDITAATKNKYR
jgi:hypothetical protein